MTLTDKINAAIDAGHTIQVATYLRVTRVSPKTRASWRSAGFEYFRTNDAGEALMIEGKKNGRPVYVRFGGAKVAAI